MSKVVLITGGSSGIGKAIGEHLMYKGFIVYGSSRNPDRYPDSKFKLVQLDVRNFQSIDSAVESVMDYEGRIDVLINNAGVGINGPIEEIPRKEILNNFETNLFGPIDVIKSVLPYMRENNSGLIINITSIAGYMGLPYRGIYSSSKGALELISESLSMELKQFNINVVSLAPGDFATNIAAGRYHAPVKSESPYQNDYSQILKSIDKDVDGGSNPVEVAKAVERIIKTSNPKIHYKVGAAMQKFSIVLKRILPDRLYEKLLLKHYDL